MKVVMCRGIPGSGKTTWALRHMADHPNCKRVSLGDLRAMLDGRHVSGGVYVTPSGPWRQSNPDLSEVARDLIVAASLGCGFDVIADDVNVAPEHERTLRGIASDYGAEFLRRDFHGDVDECVRRREASGHDEASIRALARCMGQ